MNTPTNVGSITAGLNRIEGSIDWNQNLVSDDGDAFELTVPAGVNVTAIRLEVFDYQSSSGQGSARVRSFDNSVRDIRFSGNINRSDGLGTTPPIGPRTFSFGIGLVPEADFDTGDFSGDARFSYRLTVTAVNPLTPVSIAPAYRIKFQSEVGSNYRLQTTDDLEIWVDDPSVDAVAGNGSETGFYVEPLKPREFYRVRVE